MGLIEGVLLILTTEEENTPDVSNLSSAACEHRPSEQFSISTLTCINVPSWRLSKCWRTVFKIKAIGPHLRGNLWIISYFFNVWGFRFNLYFRIGQEITVLIWKANIKLISIRVCISIVPVWILLLCLMINLSSRKIPGLNVYAQMQNEKEQEMTSPVNPTEARSNSQRDLQSLEILDTEFNSRPVGEYTLLYTFQSSLACSISLNFHTCVYM